MRRKGNIMVAFILILVLSMISFSLFFVLGGRLRSVTGGQNYTKALYIAEAGIEKAIWYLSTPVAPQGGRGTGWRTTGSTEAFDIGTYTMSIFDVSDKVRIISSGEAGGVVRKVQVDLTASSLPAAFDYALYNDGDLTVGGAVSITGDIFADGDITVNNPAEVSGEVFVPDGYTIDGSGDYTVGGTLPDPPEMPFLDTSYYDGYIATAATYPTGDLVLENYDLNGQTLYVNGSVRIIGNLTGSGEIIATNFITFESPTTAPGITYIAGNQISLIDSTNVNDSLLFASNEIYVSGTPRVEGSLMSANVEVAGTPSIFGVVYAWGLIVSLGTSNIYGCLISPSSQTFEGNISIVYDPSYLPAAPPPGMTAGGYSKVPGSWKEL